MHYITKLVIIIVTGRWYPTVGAVIWVEAFLFAVDQINRDPDLLPGVNLGYMVKDTCADAEQVSYRIKATIALQKFQLNELIVCGALPIRITLKVCM